MNDDPKNDARYQRGYVPDVSADAAASDLKAFLSPATDDQPAASADSTENGSAPSVDADELLDQFEPRNPFVIALWIVGPALIVGGPMLQTRSIYDSYRGGSAGFTSNDIPFEVVLQQLTYSVSPSMVGVGLATVVGLLFYQALRWRSRSTRR